MLLLLFLEMLLLELEQLTAVAVAAAAYPATLAPVFMVGVGFRCLNYPPCIVVYYSLS